MSGFVESRCGLEIGAPPLNSSKWLPPTSRDTKIACLPFPTSSDQVAHGTVGVPAVSVPAATRTSSASWAGSAFSEQASSAATEAAHAPKPLGPEVSTGLTCTGGPAVPRPTARPWKPPSALGSATVLAANTCSLLRSPSWLWSFSYQGTHATVSFGPVNAMSGSTPLRLASTFSDGSPVDEEPPFGSRRSDPTCCQQNRLT